MPLSLPIGRITIISIPAIATFLTSRISRRRLSKHPATLIAAKSVTMS